jgi:transcription elongation factor GreB
VSKAFTKDDDQGPPPVVPRRAPLPPGQVNYVTARGLALLRDELARLRTEATEAAGGGDTAALAAWNERIAELEERIGSAELVPVPVPPPAEARFGACVTVLLPDGKERQFTIVGVDEADANAGRIAFLSPVARALLGKRAGDAAVVSTPHGDEELELLHVRYDSPE